MEGNFRNIQLYPPDDYSEIITINPCQAFKHVCSHKHTHAMYEAKYT
jgi:hypothetical protein